MSQFSSGVIRSAGGILASRIFGLLRDIAIAAFYGATALTDIFFVAFAVPNLFRAFFAEGALASAFVPFLNDRLKNEGETSAGTYLTSLAFVTGIIIAAIIIVISFFAEKVVLIFMPGYADMPALVSSAGGMLVILMPYLLFVTLCGMLSGYLHLKGSYFVPYSSSALLNIMMISGAYLGYKAGLNVYYLCYSVFAGGVIQLVYIAVYAGRKGLHVRLKKAVDSDVKKTFHLLGPSLVGVGITQLNFTIGRIAASYLAVGSISYLYYANRLFQFPLGIFAVAVGTVSLAEISKANTDKNTASRHELIDKAIIAIFTIILPATAGLIILSEEITTLVYMRKTFTPEAAADTASALRMYSAGLLFFSFINVFSRVFHAEKNTKTPVKAAGVSFVIYGISMLVLIKPMGHDGIALASSISALINAGILYFLIKEYKFSIKQHMGKMSKILSACSVMSVAAALMREHMHVIYTIIICVLLYFFTLMIVRFNIRQVLK